MATEATLPAQEQATQPGIESIMHPEPVFFREKKQFKLEHKRAIITGGDSGIGRAVAVLFAQEGADVLLVYLNEHTDAQETKRAVEAQGRACYLLPGDLGSAAFCKQVAQKAKALWGHVDILVNNAAEQHAAGSIEEISDEQLERTYKTNIFSFFYLTKAVLPLMLEESAIINTTSVTAYEGNDHLLDYATTKGAIVTFTRSLAQQLAHRHIRVNAVAPGPIWTPLIPASFTKEKVKTFGADTLMKRPGQPAECAPAYVFLASQDGSYITGQTIHINGGRYTSS
jgi:NAD(P)-dependent dehydrogenase (short-subunit alcohol dehydrogenase family)